MTTQRDQPHLTESVAGCSLRTKIRQLARANVMCYRFLGEGFFCMLLSDMTLCCRACASANEELFSF